MSLEHFPLLAPGVEPGGEPATIVAPWDRLPIATIDRTGRAGVERALETAYALYRDRDGWLTVGERVAILERASALIKQRREHLAREAAREGGKPLIDSRVEVDRAVESVKLCAEYLRTQSGREIPMGLNAASDGKLAFTRHEPIGVVVAFSAFNHPINLIAHQVGPAVATGCPVIVKPAEATPLSCTRFVSILNEAGLPEEWCQALQTTDHDVSAALLSDDRVAFFTFIGSDRVGWMLRSKLAPGTRCALEHGGAAPVIVATDADLDDTLPRLAKGGLYHAGQVCVSVQRVFADRTIAHAVASRLGDLAREMVVGDPTLEETEVGPLIRPGEVDRIEKWVGEAVDGGAEVICGGERISETCYQPTVLFDPPSDAAVSTTEIFGPVICVYPYDQMDEAIEEANRLPLSFQASVFTKNIDTALRAARRLDAAAVMINEHTAFRVDWMPFAGLKRSGLGIGGIPYTMEDMQVEKMTLIRSPEL